MWKVLVIFWNSMLLRSGVMGLVIGGFILYFSLVPIPSLLELSQTEGEVLEMNVKIGRYKSTKFISYVFFVKPKGKPSQKFSVSDDFITEEKAFSLIKHRARFYHKGKDVYALSEGETKIMDYERVKTKKIETRKFGQKLGIIWFGWAFISFIVGLFLERYTLPFLRGKRDRNGLDRNELDCKKSADKLSLSDHFTCSINHNYFNRKGRASQKEFAVNWDCLSVSYCQ